MFRAEGSGLRILRFIGSAAPSRTVRTPERSERPNDPNVRTSERSEQLFGGVLCLGEERRAPDPLALEDDQ
jgi:hypothetical protein